MDPITGAIVATVLYAFSIPASFFILMFLGGMLFGALNEDLIPIGGFIGFIVAWGWTVFAAIQGIIQLVRVIQLLAFPEVLA